jgi:hypothetical protein
MYNILYDDPNVIKQIRATILLNQAAGVTLTEFISEGTQFQGLSSFESWEAALYATERFLDEYYGQLITETAPNFNTYPIIIPGTI